MPMMIGASMMCEKRMCGHNGSFIVPYCRRASVSNCQFFFRRDRRNRLQSGLGPLDEAGDLRAGRGQAALARDGGDDRGNRFVRRLVVEAAYLRAEASVPRRQRGDQRNRRLALGQIVAGGLAERAFVGGHVEEIVLHLKRDAEGFAELAQRRDLARDRRRP